MQIASIRKVKYEQTIEMRCTQAILCLWLPFSSPTNHYIYIISFFYLFHSIESISSTLRSNLTRCKIISPTIFQSHLHQMTLISCKSRRNLIPMWTQITFNMQAFLVKWSSPPQQGNEYICQSFKMLGIRENRVLLDRTRALWILNWAVVGSRSSFRSRTVLFLSRLRTLKTSYSLFIKRTVF